MKGLGCSAEQAFVYLMNFDNLGDKIKKLKVALRGLFSSQCEVHTLCDTQPMSVRLQMSSFTRRASLELLCHFQLAIWTKLIRYTNQLS